MTTMTLGYDNDFVDKPKVDVIVTVECRICRFSKEIEQFKIRIEFLAIQNKCLAAIYPGSSEIRLGCPLSRDGPLLSGITKQHCFCTGDLLPEKMSVGRKIRGAYLLKHKAVVIVLTSRFITMHKSFRDWCSF